MQKTPATGIIMATLIEALPFLEGMSFKPCEKRPFKSYRTGECVLTVSGIGKANAAMAALYCIMKYNPRSVCNLGAAGAADLEHPLGETYHISKVVEYDRPALSTGTPHIHIPHILEGFPTAELATLDSPVHEPKIRAEISSCADLIDMEGASVVQACKKYNTRCLLFKFVSDTPENLSSEAIVDNIRRHRSTFYTFFSASILPMLIT